MCPVADAAGTYTITLQLVYDVPPTSDLTRWGGIYFGVTTDDCPDDVDTSTGYLVALRWDGTLEVFGQPSDSTGMVSLGVTATSPIVTPVLSGALTAGVARHLPSGHRPADRGAARTPIHPSDRAGRHAAPRPRRGVPPPCPSSSLTPSAEVAAGHGARPGGDDHDRQDPGPGSPSSRTDDGASASYTDSTWSGGYVFLRNSRDTVAERLLLVPDDLVTGEARHGAQRRHPRAHGRPGGLLHHLRGRATGSWSRG